MPSKLTFIETQFVRNSLLVRNLKPYAKPGVYTPVGVSGVDEYIRSD
jgi:hypothetical protein